MEKDIKNIDVEQCILIIICTAIFSCIAFVPITFGEQGIKLTLSALPYIGDNYCLTIQTNAFTSLFNTINIQGVTLPQLIGFANFCTFLFFFILVADLLFAVILLIFRSETCRVIFRIVSIIFGITMLLIAFIHLLQFIGAIMYMASASTEIKEALLKIDNSGILTAISLIVLSFVMCKRQFKWFTTIW